jgi:hypothetical protein
MSDSNRATDVRVFMRQDSLTQLSLRFALPSSRQLLWQSQARAPASAGMTTYGRGIQNSDRTSAARVAPDACKPMIRCHRRQHPTIAITSHLRRLDQPTPWAETIGSLVEKNLFIRDDDQNHATAPNRRSTTPTCSKGHAARSSFQIGRGRALTHAEDRGLEPVLRPLGRWHAVHDDSARSLGAGGNVGTALEHFDRRTVGGRAAICGRCNRPR